MAAVTSTDRTTAVWHPQPRPEWVAQFNAMGRNPGDPSAIVPLNESSLLEAAVAATSLTDFGGDDWRVGFGLLVSDLNEHAQLNLMGRVLARAELLRSLINRLRVAEAYRVHPEIDDENVEAPVLISGWGRSGTTILHELMSVDPSWRSARTWELLYPAALPDSDGTASDPRIQMAEDDHMFWNHITPDYRAMHDNSARAVGEDETGTLHGFSSLTWTGLYNVPNYTQHALSHEGRAHDYRFHRRLLKLLQFQEPGRWLLKGPGHTFTLPELFHEYPDVRVITMHRDPLKTLGSMASLTTKIKYQRSDVVDPDTYVQTFAAMQPLIMQKMISERDGGTVPDDRFFDVRYGDLMKDPTGVIGQICEWLGRPYTGAMEEQIREFLQNRPQHKFGVHEYSFHDLGLDEASVRAGFKEYIDRFQIPLEKL